MPYKIEIDRNACISAASCVAIAPGTFQLDSEGKVFIVKEDGDAQDLILEAAKSCPVQCIVVKDETGKQIFPE